MRVGFLQRKFNFDFGRRTSAALVTGVGVGSSFPVFREGAICVSRQNSSATRRVRIHAGWKLPLSDFAVNLSAPAKTAGFCSSRRTDDDLGDAGGGEAESVKSEDGLTEGFEDSASSVLSASSDLPRGQALPLLGGIGRVKRRAALERRRFQPSEDSASSATLEYKAQQTGEGSGQTDGEEGDSLNAGQNLPPPLLSSLPVIGLLRRPAFPGFYQLLHIPDQELFDALVQHRRGGGFREFVGGFLVKDERRVSQNAVETEAGVAGLKSEGEKQSASSKSTLPIVGLTDPGARLREDAGMVRSLGDVHEVGCLLHVLTLAPHANLQGGQAVVMPYRRIKIVGPAQKLEDSEGEASSAATSLVEAESSFGETKTEELEAETRTEDESLKNAQRDGGAEETKSVGPDEHLASTEAATVSKSSETSAASIGEESSQGAEERRNRETLAEADDSQRVSTAPFTFENEGGGSLTALSFNSPAAGSEAGRERNPLIEAMVAFAKEGPLVAVGDAKAARPDGRPSVLQTLHLEILATVKELLKTSYFYKEHFEQVIRFYNLDFPHKLADLVAGMSFASRDQLQAVLAEENIEKRLLLVLEIAKRDLEAARLQMHVKAQVEERMAGLQRKLLLSEQLKLIKQELGIGENDRENIVEGFREAFEKKKEFMSEEVQAAIQYEISRLASLESSSAEVQIVKSYLDTLTGLPWGQYTTDATDIEAASATLEAEHFGLEDVKKRILEFIAVAILKGQPQGKILCLVGPPGVGKTSVGESIAKALQRKFYRISLGGLTDVAELRGHRRTYVGALPGKIVRALKVTGCMNPLVLLDEIDKLGRDTRGEPASVLLEVLDPSQNSAFSDQYLEVPIDVSKVLFVCTANSTDTIPAPLLDRMEVIRIAGYLLEEKMSIASKYLIPKTAESTGLSGDKVQISSEALRKLATDYAREAGVRTLAKCIEKAYRRAALGVVKKTYEKVEITESNLETFADHPPFSSARIFDLHPPGVVMGLAWTSCGGSVIYVEAVGRLTELKANSKDSARNAGLKVTGSLGAVMAESVDIALTMAKRFVNEKDPSNNYLENAFIHLHVPEGATPKDGPSAGITMATAIVSLALQLSPIPNVAMTGELTLTGKVLKVGGIKEKVIAAKRENVTTLVLPRANQRDYEELPANVKDGIEVHFVELFSEVYDVALKPGEGKVGPDSPCLSEDESRNSDGVSSSSHQEKLSSQRPLHASPVLAVCV